MNVENSSALSWRYLAALRQCTAEWPATRSPRGVSGPRHKRINISTVLAGQRLGIKEVDDGIWLASFMLLISRIFRPGAENLATPRQPVRPEVVTHVLGTTCYPCLRAGQAKAGGEGVSQSPLKYKAFSTFLDQNPPFELRPKMGFRLTKACPAQWPVIDNNVIKRLAKGNLPSHRSA